MATQLRRNQGGPADRLTWTPTILGTYLLVTQFWSKLVKALMAQKSLCVLLLKQGAAFSDQNSLRPSWHCSGNWAPSSQWGGWLSLPQVEPWSQIDRWFQQVDFKVTGSWRCEFKPCQGIEQQKRDPFKGLIFLVQRFNWPCFYMFKFHSSVAWSAIIPTCASLEIHELKPKAV